MLVVIIAVLFGAFLYYDADLPLVFLPYKLEGSYTGKIIWITGASSGIGASLAEDLTKAGAQVIISARRVEQLEKVAEKCSQLGLKPFIQPLDVTDNFEVLENTYNSIIEKFGFINIVVLNAGQSQRNLAVDTPLSDTKHLMNLNFFSYVALAKLILPKMIERNQGQLVIMSSLSGIIGTPIASSYSASKFALHGYFNTLRSEVSMHNITVSIVCPGPVESEISDKTLRNPANPKQEEGKKMPTARCTFLVAKGMYYKFSEMWISDQPFLLTTYLTSYMPAVARLLFAKAVGPARVKALKAGQNIYSSKV
eukprot:gene11290-15147_t